MTATTQPKQLTAWLTERIGQKIEFHVDVASTPGEWWSLIEAYGPLTFRPRQERSIDTFASWTVADTGVCIINWLDPHDESGLRVPCEIDLTDRFASVKVPLCRSGELFITFTLMDERETHAARRRRDHHGGDNGSGLDV
jgi:hypothetical protein